jgi:hypothetical protein
MMIEADSEAGVAVTVKKAPAQSFDFRNDSTKLAYAATKLLISSFSAVVYWIVVKISFGQKAAEPKQWLVILALVALTQYRDKFEKKIVSMYEP